MGPSSEPVNLKNTNLPLSPDHTPPAVPAATTTVAPTSAISATNTPSNLLRDLMTTPLWIDYPRLPAGEPRAARGTTQAHRLEAAQYPSWQPDRVTIPTRSWARPEAVAFNRLPMTTFL